MATPPTSRRARLPFHPVLRAAAFAVLCVVGGARAQPEGQAATASPTVLVLDASGSMMGKLGGQTKQAMARKAVEQLVQAWPRDTPLGLVAYGHRSKGDCKDIQVVVPPAAGTADVIRQRVARMGAKGMTPVAASLLAAAEQVRGGGRRGHIILVSDGEETCNADPCATAQSLRESGVELTAHVIGFDLPAGPAREQLACVARVTGGRYVEARNAAELGDALQDLGAVSWKTRGGDTWMPDVNLVPEPSVQLANGTAEQVGYVDMKQGDSARACEAMCVARQDCGAWTYEPTGSFFVDHPRCALKSRNFGLTVERQDVGAGWVSGIKPGMKLIMDGKQP